MKANGGAYDPIPIDQALAYIIEVLPAFQYLHDLGLVYCDFKPDNMIQVGDAMKLIDLGGVRRIDDQESAIYGTVGYQAPEVAQVGPSVASDIYTIGRTLLVLCMEFRGYQGTYLHTLPPPETTPLFAQNDSLYWLIAKCCAPDPADRFASADELRTQMLGVLREEIGERTIGTSSTVVASALFEAPTSSRSVLEWGQLPDLRADSTDSQHGWLQSVPDDNPAERLKILTDQAPEQTPEVMLARAYTALGLNDLTTVHSVGGADALRRPVGVAGAVGRRPGLDAGPQLGVGQGVVQRGLPAGARRARAQAGPGGRVRARRSARGRRGPLHHLRLDRRGLHRARRRSASPGCGPSARDAAGAVAGARLGAAHQPRLPREPSAARRGAALARAAPTCACSTRRCARSSRRRWTRPTQGRYTVRILEQGLTIVGAGGGTQGRHDRVLPGHRRRAARGPGARLPPARPRRLRPARAHRAGQQGQRRPSLEPDMTAAPLRGRGRGRRRLLRELRQARRRPGHGAAPRLAPVPARPRRSTTWAAGRSARRPG